MPPEHEVVSQIGPLNFISQLAKAAQYFRLEIRSIEFHKLNVCCFQMSFGITRYQGSDSSSFEDCDTSYNIDGQEKLTPLNMYNSKL